MNKIILSVLAICLAACANVETRLDDGYQVGDLTGTAIDSTVKVLTIQQQYCATQDPVARAVLLKIIRSTMPLYPKDGLCTDVLNAVSE